MASFFDVSLCAYCRDLLQGKLPQDEALLQDPELKQLIETYAADQVCLPACLLLGCIRTCLLHWRVVQQCMSAAGCACKHTDSSGSGHVPHVQLRCILSALTAFCRANFSRTTHKRMRPSVSLAHSYPPCSLAAQQSQLQTALGRWETITALRR